MAGKLRNQISRPGSDRHWPTTNGSCFPAKRFSASSRAFHARERQAQRVSIGSGAVPGKTRRHPTFKDFWQEDGRQEHFETRSASRAATGTGQPQTVPVFLPNVFLPARGLFMHASDRLNTFRSGPGQSLARTGVTRRSKTSGRKTDGRKTSEPDQPPWQQPVLADQKHFLISCQTFSCQLGGFSCTRATDSARFDRVRGSPWQDQASLDVQRLLAGRRSAGTLRNQISRPGSDRNWPTTRTSCFPAKRFSASSGAFHARERQTQRVSFGSGAVPGKTGRHSTFKGTDGGPAAGAGHWLRPRCPEPRGRGHR
jgi:hypothetical protein